MSLLLVVFALTWCVGSGQTPGSCQCLTTTSNVNVRASPCGSVLGTTYAPYCYTTTGQSDTCDMAGSTYTFYQVGWANQNAWISNDYLSEEPASACARCMDFDRSEWSARPPTSTTPLNLPVPYYFVHHSEGSHCYDVSTCMVQMRAIQNYHMDSQGWSDIGYNFLIGEDGFIYEGRGWQTLGAHTGEWNPQSIGICVIGTFFEGAPNDLALEALDKLMQCGYSNGYLSPDYTVHGHRDGMCRTCPGDYFYFNILATWDRFAGCLSGHCTDPENCIRP